MASIPDISNFLYSFVNLASGIVCVYVHLWLRFMTIYIDVDISDFRHCVHLFAFVGYLNCMESLYNISSWSVLITSAYPLSVCGYNLGNIPQMANGN